MPRMPIVLRLTGCELSRDMIQEVEACMLRPKPESVLLRSEARCWRIPQRRGSFFDRLRNTVCRCKKTQTPVARLRQLLMRMGGGSLSALAGDPTLLERIEAHLCESSDLELQQLVKKYLAEV